MDRLESFEEMLSEIEREYAGTTGKLEALKKKGKPNRHLSGSFWETK